MSHYTDIPDDDGSPDGGGPPVYPRTPLQAIDKIRARATDDQAMLDHIANTRTRIGHLRRQCQAWQANTLREQLLCEVESWVNAAQKEHTHVPA